MSRILTRFPSLHGKELSLKYADTLNDWIELPADDLDSFVDMIETAKDSARENCKTTELKVCELAQTPKQTAQERLRSSSSPNYESTSGSVHVAKNQPARRLDEEFTCSLNETTDDIEYESPTDNTRYLSSRAVSSRRLVLQGNRCVQIVILQGTTKLCAPLHPALLLQYVKRLSGILLRRNISRRGSPNSKPLRQNSSN